MQLGSVLLLLAALVVLGAGERQRFCYKRVGYTRKHVERELLQGALREDSCDGPDCAKPRPATHYKTEVVYRTERHCCAGYQSSRGGPDACEPVCPRGCAQGERCSAPNRCECAEGYERDSEGRCVAASGSLPGDEPATLQSQILSYVNLLLNGVKSLSWESAAAGHDSSLAAVSAPAAREEIPTARAAPGLYSEGATASCTKAFRLLDSAAGTLRANGSGLEPLSLQSASNCSSQDARPLVVPLVLGGQSFATAQLR